MGDQRVCFNENEAFEILWAIAEALANAIAADALSDAASIEETRTLVRTRIDEQRPQD